MEENIGYTDEFIKIIYDCAGFWDFTSHGSDSTSGFSASTVEELEQQFTEWAEEMEARQKAEPDGNWWKGEVRLESCWDSRDKEGTYIEI